MDQKWSREPVSQKMILAQQRATACAGCFRVEVRVTRGRLGTIWVMGWDVEDGVSRMWVWVVLKMLSHDKVYDSRQLLSNKN